MAKLKTVLFLNAALAGAEGNSAELLAALATIMQRRVTILPCVLKETAPASALKLLAQADGLVLATGTYWDSWSSLLQAWLEAATPTEGTATWLGKPAAVLVTAHAVGGKGVLSRLQGVLSTFGCLIPPQSGLVTTWVNQIALKNRDLLHQDLWSGDDLQIIGHNLLVALNAKSKKRYKSWPVDRKNFDAKWLNLTEIPDNNRFIAVRSQNITHKDHKKKK